MWFFSFSVQGARFCRIVLPILVTDLSPLCAQLGLLPFTSALLFLSCSFPLVFSVLGFTLIGTFRSLCSVTSSDLSGSPDRISSPPFTLLFL